MANLKFSQHFFQKNTGQSNGKPRLDLNVEKAWAMGFTGKNITTAIMDDGVDYMHPDLKNNYVKKLFKIKKIFGKFRTPMLATIFHRMTHTHIPAIPMIGSTRMEQGRRFLFLLTF